MSGSVDLRSEWLAQLDRAGAALGLVENDIPVGMSFRAWCESLAESGQLKVDQKKWSLADRAALIPIYDAIPTTREEASHRIVVVQKSTQIGLTIWEVLADVYMARKWAPVNIGLYTPDQTTAGFKSQYRWMPIIRSIPTIYRDLIHRESPDGSMLRIGEGNILTRQLNTPAGASLFGFLWTSGKLSTESRPFDIVSLDEVQTMSMDEIDKVRARTGDSEIRFTLMLSTANLPDLDINAWYQLGSQEVWHSRCEHCNALSDLSDPAGIFPDRSIAYNAGRFPDAPEDYVWTCPVCGGWMKDPQIGEYVALNPRSDPLIRSFLLPRTISPRMTAREMYVSFSRAKTGDQKKSFYNRTLARPYIDANQIPVTLAHCAACVEEGSRMGLEWETRAGDGDYYCGIDQMGSFNVVIVKKRLIDGRQGVVHVEAIYADDPFARCAEIMDDFNISLCCVEQLPNANDARRFSNKFKGRVFLAGYADMRDDMIVWGDAATRSDRKTAEEDRSRWSVSLNQYRCMQTSLYRVRDKFCLFPDPDKLEQDILDNGEWRRSPILRDMVFHHLTKTALIVEEDETTRKRRAKVLKIGIDPHFSYANLLVDVAWARIHGASSFIMPQGMPHFDPPKTDMAKEMEKQMPGLPRHVLAMVDDLPQSVCGRCHNASSDGRRCELRLLAIAPQDASCSLYEPRAA